MVISWIVAVGILVGMADTLAGNRFGIGEKFQQGFRLIGSMMISMAGIMALAPALAALVEPAVVPFFHRIGVDPGMFGILMGNDMGGYQMAMSLAENEKIGLMAGGITAGMLGGTLNFSIPMGFGLIEKEDAPYFSRGILIGVSTIPVGSIVSGLLLGIPAETVVWNHLPVLVLTVLIAAGFLKFQDGMVRMMGYLGKLVEWAGLIGIGIGSFTYLTGVTVIPGMTPILDTMGIVCSVNITMIGMFPVLEIFTRCFRRLLYRAGEHIGLNVEGCSGLIFTMASAAPVFLMMKDMGKRGVVLNAAWIVSCAAVFGSQMGLIMGIGMEYLPAFLAGKLLSGMAALAVGLLYTRRWR